MGIRGGLIVLILLTFSIAHADRYYVATALDTEGYESGFSNVVHVYDWIGNTITFQWTPNSEPDIYGYRIWVNCADEYGYMPIPIEIYHLDYCLEECEITLSLDNPTIIIGGAP